MIHLYLPVAESEIRKLRVGDQVSLSGTIVTARDAAHKLMVEARPDFIRSYLKDGAIYHCGPVMQKEGDHWRAVAAGPTTSSREEPYEAEVMNEYTVRVIIGKGGMGAKTAAACRDCGAVYIHAVGGAAVLLADSIVEVRDVFMLSELGAPEAFWICRVEGFKGIVTIDSTGASLHASVLAASENNRHKLSR